MLPDATLPVPASPMTLLTGFGPLFTAPFRMFCGLARGFVAQTGKRTVCGMLAGRACPGSWSHDRAHFFFSGPGGTLTTWAWPSRGWRWPCWCRPGNTSRRKRESRASTRRTFQLPSAVAE
jgi:hypothetical protein